MEINISKEENLNEKEENNENGKKIENNDENKKEYLFSLAKINKYFIFPFLCPVFCMIGNYFIFKIFHDDDIKGVNNKEFLLSVLVCMSYIGGGLLYFISSLRIKTEETRNEANKYRQRESSISSIKYIYNDGLKKNKYLIFGIIFIMSISLILSEICSLHSLEKNVFEARLYFLFFISLFSKIILKDNIFKHQILSLFIAFIGLILLFIPIMLVIEKGDIIINICLFLTSVLYSLFFVLIKFLTQNCYMSPYLCLLYLGFFSTILILIGYALYSLIIYKDLSFITHSFDFSNVENQLKLVKCFILIFIFGSILQTLSVLVIYYFSPTLLMVTDIISPMLLWIVISIQSEDLKIINIVFNSLGYCIVLFSSLIYNEIIICNFYGFNKYTKKCLKERQNKESNLLRKTENEIKSGKQNEEGNENDSSFDSDVDGDKSN